MHRIINLCYAAIPKSRMKYRLHRDEDDEDPREIRDVCPPPKAQKIKKNNFTWNNWCTTINSTTHDDSREVLDKQLNYMERGNFVEGFHTFREKGFWIRFDDEQKRAIESETCVFKSTWEACKDRPEYDVIQGFMIRGKNIKRHACICTVSKDKSTTFIDVSTGERGGVMFGVIVRKDFLKALSKLESYCRYSALDGIEFLTYMRRNREQLGDVLERISEPAECYALQI
jgi:hypothetical protein